MKSILEKERELFVEAWKLREASFEVGKNKGNKEKQFKKARELQMKENEAYKKQQFFRNYLKEMEKRKND